MSAGSAGAEEHHEVVIIGGGMAGLSCALECYDIQLDTIVLEMQARGRRPDHRDPVPRAQRGGGCLRRRAPVTDGRRAVGGHPRRPGPPIVAGRPDRPRRAMGGVGRPTAGGGRHRDRNRGGAPAAARRRRRGLRRRRDLPTGVGPRPIRRPPRGGDRRRGQRHPRRPGPGTDRVPGHPGAPLRRASARGPDIAGQLRDDPRITELGGWELDGVHGEDRLEEVVLVRLATGERRSVKAGGLVVKSRQSSPDRALSGPARNRPLRRGRGRRDAGDLTPRRVRRRRRRRRRLLADRHRHRAGVAGGEIRPAAPGGRASVTGDPRPCLRRARW